jgi:ABC-type phosphate transport system substrate-binding protein
VLVTLVAVVLGGCGIEANQTSTGATRAAAASASSSLSAQQREQAERFAALPKPVPGVVNVAQGATLGITSQVIDAYEATDPGVTVNTGVTSAAEGFRELCTGQMDIAEATQPMTSAELALCAQNGVRFKTDAGGNPVPIELAADGIVVATKNQQDVGGDCVRLSTLRDIFRSGSTVDNWNQLGFDNLPLTTAGRSPATDTFQLFANLVLGSEGNSTLADVRSGYQVRPTDDGVRALVAGTAAAQRVANDEHTAVARDLQRSAARLSAAQNAAGAAANQKVLAQIDTANQARAKAGVTLSAAQAEQLVTNNALMDSRAKAAAAAAARAAFTERITAQVARQYAAESAAAENPGVAGVFRYTYYELYEERLRPLEIWDPATTLTELEDEGIATSGSTAAERSSRTGEPGGEGATAEPVTFARTPTKPGARYMTADGHEVTVPAGGPVNLSTTPNCVFPSRQTITSGVYPLSVRLLAYVPENRLRRADVINYLAYYLAQGQNTVAAQRLIPLDDTTRETEYQQLTGRTLSQKVLLDGESPAGLVQSGSTPISTTGATSSSDSATSGSTTSPTFSTGVPGVG